MVAACETPEEDVTKVTIQPETDEEKVALMLELIDTTRLTGDEIAERVGWTRQHCYKRLAKLGRKGFRRLKSRDHGGTKNGKGRT